MEVAFIYTLIWTTGSHSTVNRPTKGRQAIVNHQHNLILRTTFPNTIWHMIHSNKQIMPKYISIQNGPVFLITTRVENWWNTTDTLDNWTQFIKQDVLSDKQRYFRELSSESLFPRHQRHQSSLSLFLIMLLWSGHGFWRKVTQQHRRIHNSQRNPSYVTARK